MTTTQRPPPAEWDGDSYNLTAHPHGTPLTINGKLQAATRDATFLARPDTHTTKVRHIVVASHHLAIAGGTTGPAAACDPTRIMTLDTTTDAAATHPNGRCARPGCTQLFQAANARDEKPSTKTGQVVDGGAGASTSYESGRGAG